MPRVESPPTTPGLSPDRSRSGDPSAPLSVVPIHRNRWFRLCYERGPRGAYAQLATARMMGSGSLIRPVSPTVSSWSAACEPGNVPSHRPRTVNTPPCGKYHNPDPRLKRGRHHPAAPRAPRAGPRARRAPPPLWTARLPTAGPAPPPSASGRGGERAPASMQGPAGLPRTRNRPRGGERGQSAPELRVREPPSAR